MYVYTYEFLEIWFLQEKSQKTVATEHRKWLSLFSELLETDLNIYMCDKPKNVHVDSRFTADWIERIYYYY